jgi:uncharacterized protein
MLDVVVLFFLLGLIARLAKSDLKLPQALYETLSVFLLLAIGLKGGVELHRQPVAVVLPQVLACIAFGFSVPFLLVPLIKRLGFSGVDSAVLAAHYGSVSVVTFAVCTAYLQRQGVSYESHAALWVAVMEAPGIVAGIALARMALKQESKSKAAEQQPTRWGELAHEIFFGKSILLLAGGLVIGAVMGEQGIAPIAPLFTDLFKGVLALFLLELGLVAGDRVGDIRRLGARLLLVGIGAPLVLAILGALTGRLLGLTTGGVAVFATLAASASYIAAPTAMRIAVPQGNAGLSIAAALGITFPFNILIGVPLYLQFARWISP